MINSFSQYLVEEERVVYFTFGKMNPPTVDHGKLLEKVAAEAGRNPYKVFLSQAQNESKDPLTYNEKVKYVRKMFPKHARQVLINKKIVSPHHALSELYEQGYRKVVMVVGSDRVNEFEQRLNMYNGKEGRHGFYNFKEGVKVISAEQKDVDTNNRQLQLVQENNFTAFSQALPTNVSTKDARRLFNDVRKGMGLTEERNFKNHLQLEPISETRESFVNGELFDLGEQVIIKDTDEVGIITVLGSNYVIVETAEGKRSRKWLDAVEKIEEQDNKKSMYKDKPDWGTPESTKKWKKTTPGQDVSEKIKTAQDPDVKDREGTQPKRYYKGLAKTTKAARDRHFKRGTEMDDDNPAAYKPAPGDATAKTKPSKYTLKFKKMYGEAKDPVDVAKARVNRQKEIAARRHDQIMDRARLLKAKQKNQETK
jgi:hypothetical protein